MKASEANRTQSSERMSAFKGMAVVTFQVIRWIQVLEGKMVESVMSIV